MPLNCMFQYIFKWMDLDSIISDLDSNTSELWTQLDLTTRTQLGLGGVDYITGMQNLFNMPCVEISQCIYFVSSLVHLIYYSSTKMHCVTLETSYSPLLYLSATCSLQKPKTENQLRLNNRQLHYFWTNRPHRASTLWSFSRHKILR